MDRTIADWVRHAQATTDAAELNWSLDQALGLATAAHEYRMILQGALAIGSLPDARRDEVIARTLESAIVDRDVWAFRDVAAARAVTLSDLEGARRALDTAVDLFQTPRTDVMGQAAAALGKVAFARGYEWVILGQGYRETLSDDAGLERCLALGREAARAAEDADDLCSIAVAWAAQLDRSIGIELIREAEALEKNGSASPWTLANAWSSVADEAGLRRVLEAGLKRAKTVEEALHIARAWHSNNHPKEAKTAIQGAEKLAKNAPGWVAIAEVVFDSKLGDKRLRDCLLKAEKLAKGPIEKERVAAAYQQWLKDEAAAKRVGPRGLPPEALRHRIRPLEGWEASASGLFEWFCARATTEILTSIAHADYSMNAQKHLAALSDICHSGNLPRQMAWEPHEVLALTRWQEGERTNHLERGLSTLLLCICPQGMDELVTNGVILLDSCLALGDETTALAQALFVWLAETTASQTTKAGDWDPEEPIALLLLLFATAKLTPADPRLERLADRLLKIARHPPMEVDSDLRQSMRATLWAKFFGEILGPLREEQPYAARVLAAFERN
jgi:hypothetical protein